MTELLPLPDGSEVETEEIDLAIEVEGLGTVTAHANKARSRLIGRFQLPVYRAIAKAAGEEIQEAENMLWNVLLSRYIDSAAGVSLNYLGNRVGERRQGLEDPEYRVRIRTRILINKSRGGPEDILTIIRALGGHGTIWNTGNASMHVEVNELPVSGATRRQIAGLLGEAVSAGVRLHVSVPTSATPFRLGDAFTDTDFGGTLQDAFAGDVADTEQLTDGRSV